MSESRYSRQARFVPLGEEGQRKIGNAEVVVVGCGGLGGVAAELLARAGIGRLKIIDRDFVELTNLPRQFLFDEQDAAEELPKAVAAKRRLSRINSEIDITAIVDDLRSRSAEDLLGAPDVILDATDNFEARFLMNDYSVRFGIPWIYGAAVGSYGISMPVLPGQTPCLRCLYPSKPEGLQPTCESEGVIGTATALIGTIQANAALMIASGNARALRRTIVTADVWNGTLREIAQPDRDPACVCCAEREFPSLDGALEPPISLCGRNAVQIHARNGFKDLRQLQQRLQGEGDVRVNEFALRFSRGPHQLTVFADGRAIVKGTQDPALARSLYARWIGS